MLDDLDIKKLTIAILFNSFSVNGYDSEASLKQAYEVYSEIHKIEMKRYERH